ncbi:MAG: TolC family protein, partial [Planctomycetota bacterium JB042]
MIGSGDGARGDLVRPPRGARAAGRFRRAWVAVPLTLSACVVGPDYEPPETRLPPEWAARLDDDLSVGDAALSRYWEELSDPLLDR